MSIEFDRIENEGISGQMGDLLNMGSLLDMDRQFALALQKSSMSDSQMPDGFPSGDFLFAADAGREQAALQSARLKAQEALGGQSARRNFETRWANEMKNNPDLDVISWSKSLKNGTASERGLVQALSGPELAAYFNHLSGR